MFCFSSLIVHSGTIEGLGVLGCIPGVTDTAVNWTALISWWGEMTANKNSAVSGMAGTAFYKCREEKRSVLRGSKATGLLCSAETSGWTVLGEQSTVR